MASRLLDLLAEIVIGVEVKNICYQIEGILVVRDFRVQTCQIEPVCQVILIDFTEVLISARRDELKIVKPKELAKEVEEEKRIR